MTTHIKIKTWGCTDCKYLQDFNPENTEQWKQIFPDVQQGKCPNPACGVAFLEPILDADRQITVTIVTDTEIDTFSTDEINGTGKNKGQLKKQAKEDREKFNSKEWKAD